jgi:hypothetical protein
MNSHEGRKWQPNAKRVSAEVGGHPSLPKAERHVPHGALAIAKRLGTLGPSREPFSLCDSERLRVALEPHRRSYEPLWSTPRVVPPLERSTVITSTETIGP